MLPDGKRKPAKAKLGDNLLDVVLENQLDIDGYGLLRLICKINCDLATNQSDVCFIQLPETIAWLELLSMTFKINICINNPRRKFLE